MEVEAIYENGKLEFVQPLRLKHARVRLLVTVPDHEVEEVQPSDLDLLNLPADVVERAKAMLARMEAIKNAPVPADETLPDLTEKQLERIAAFALRDEIKGSR
ncbi:hypothetical protein TVNIR_0690 [Thioalkalivibrio nitratireducens DSM 14787]|uniref:Uncharacterized protein n=1 Tax=Thioalkalivibrio nitratireducens (strain DSM 14787 / UNIQEM 213 / ALEN2) TaxID=1255043 RepID=L0DTR4_THIND|nr:hypothetical protein [Thioalkalivibrio nitratireducens]AGA32387.1 hypothetical protein TVNIR_0690 [Thioalkalivibrio nitratireducens DSM 14787]